MPEAADYFERWLSPFGQSEFQPNQLFPDWQEAPPTATPTDAPTDAATTAPAHVNCNGNNGIVS